MQEEGCFYKFLFKISLGWYINSYRNIHNLFYIKSDNCFFNIGIYWPKGCYISFGKNFTISREGIYMILSKDFNRYYILWMILARLFAIFESILFIINLPLMISFYVIAIPIFLLLIFLLFPFYAGITKFNNIKDLSLNKYNFSKFYKSLPYLLIGSIHTIFVIFILTLLIPIQIIVPEFTSLYLKVHKWGDPQNGRSIDDLDI